MVITNCHGKLIIIHSHDVGANIVRIGYKIFLWKASDFGNQKADFSFLIMIANVNQIRKKNIFKILKFNPHSSSFYREFHQDSLLCMSDFYIKLNVSVKSKILGSKCGLADGFSKQFDHTDWQRLLYRSLSKKVKKQNPPDHEPNLLFQSA